MGRGYIPERTSQGRLGEDTSDGLGIAGVMDGWVGLSINDFRQEEQVLVYDFVEDLDCLVVGDMYSTSILQNRKKSSQWLCLPFEYL